MPNNMIPFPPVGYVSRHIGKIGDKIAVHGVIRQIIGTGKALYVIHDQYGNVFTICCITYQAPGRRVHALVHFESTVMGHTEHCGVKCTEVSPGRVYTVSDDHWALRK